MWPKSYGLWNGGSSISKVEIISLAFTLCIILRSAIKMCVRSNTQSPEKCVCRFLRCIKMHMYTSSARADIVTRSRITWAGKRRLWAKKPLADWERCSPSLYPIQFIEMPWVKHGNTMYQAQCGPSWTCLTKMGIKKYEIWQWLLLVQSLLFS